MDEVIASVAPPLESKVRAYRRKHRLPGIAAGLATRDGLRWWLASGFADLETGRPPDHRTLFRIASITKTFTATAVLQLRDEGKFRLDDPAVRYLPELSSVQDPRGRIEDLTIRRLLMHTSGLQGEPPWRDLDRRWMYRSEELLEVLSLARVTLPPEVDLKYSNLGFQLLGLIVERIAERPYTEHVRASILDPLGMSDTVWDPDEGQASRQAVGFDARRHDDRPSPARQLDSHVFEAYGGLWSTLEDLGTWVGQQLRTDASLERGDGQVLRGSTLAEMHRPSFISRDDWTEAQGLCWYGTRSGETILIGHAGATWGFTSTVSFAPRDGVGAIVLVNGMADADTLARELIDVALPAIREARDRAEVPPFARLPDAWRELLGTYRDPELGLDFIVEWRDGKLVLLTGSSEAPSHDLEPTAEPLAFTIRGGWQSGEALVFSRGPAGLIDRCNVGGFPAMRVDLLRPPTWT